MQYLKKFTNWIKRQGTLLSLVLPGDNAWRGASYGLFISGPLMALIFLIFTSGHISTLGFVFALFFVLVPLFLVAGFVAEKFLSLLGRIPATYRVAFLSMGAIVIFIPTFIFEFPTSLIISGFLLIVISLTGAGMAVIVRRTNRHLTQGRKILWILGSTLGVVGIICMGIWMFAFSGPEYALPEGGLTEAPFLEVLDPTEPGCYEVLTMSYGSGTDSRRMEYGAGAAFTTESVDGSPFLDGWEGLSGWYRTRYWGFDERELPLNGLVWYPNGVGPFPLVLIVHGNHEMEDYSEGGYAYLCELLASRGYIVASVDQNFLNSSPSDLISGLESENDARGWLLLEHLRVWHEWNADPGHPFYQKVDSQNIALIGHSRGGEAVAVATMFNSLSAYPDNATVEFEYGYAIQSVIAIAPVDGQYVSGGRPMSFGETNYLTLQGSVDGDVFFFMGAQQFDRVTVDEKSFKAAVYIYGANHGQFNRSWGRSDLGWPNGWFRNLKTLMPPEDQEQIALAMVSGFLEATIRGDEAYRGLFQEPMSGRAFLPDAVILSQYADANTITLSSFEEDQDVRTASYPGANWKAKHLTLWREQRPVTKVGMSFRETTVSYVGWNRAASKLDDNAEYSLVFDEPLVADSDSILTMSLAFANDDPSPEIDSFEEDAAAVANTLDFSLLVTDSNGQIASVGLSEVSVLYSQDALGYRMQKTPLPNNYPESEIIMDTIRIPFHLFTSVNTKLDVNAIECISFVFDRNEAGVLVIDDVGISM